MRLLVAATVLAAAGAGAAQPSPLFAAALAGSDVFGEALNRRVPPGAPLLLILTNRHSQDGASRAGREMAWNLRDSGLRTVVRVDLRGLPGFLQGIARSRMQAAWRQSVHDYADAFRRAGREPPPESERTLSIVADPDGALAAREGLVRDAPQALGVVFDGDGTELARARLPGGRPELEQAIRQALGAR